MDLISFSEMDIRNMKRKELQALCKKHKIPANLTNLEMADKLASLLKEQEKPAARGKSCLKTAAEQAFENLSDVQRFSKKVRFSPENETFEFSPSAVKPEEMGRRARARKRNMLKQVEGIQGIISEKNEENVNYSEEIVNKPARVIRSRAKKAVNEIENVVETKNAKRVLRSVASESVSKLQTRVSTRRSSEIEKVDNTKKELEHDALSRKNQKKITETKELIDVVSKKKELEIITRSPPVKYSHRIKENKCLVKDKDVVTEQVVRQSKRNKKPIEDLGEIEVIEKERTKRKRGQKLEDTNVIEAALKTNDELEVVLQIEEPSRRSSRIGNRRQSIIPQNEKNITAGFKNEIENNTLVQSTIVEDDARPKRNPSRRKSVAVSDALPVENEIKNKRRILRKDTVLEKENAVIEELSLVEEPPRRSRRTGNRELSILPQSGNTNKYGSEDKEEDNNLVHSTAFEGNARPKSSSRRKSVAVSEALPVENDLKNNVRDRRKNMVLEKENVVIEGSSLVEEPPKRSRRNSNKRQLNEKPGAVGNKGENKKNPSKSSAVEENAKPRRKYSTRMSIVPSDTTLAENVRNNMPIRKRKNPVLEESNAVDEGSSFAHNRKFVENSAEAHKALVTIKNEAPMQLIVESDNSPVRNDPEVFSHNSEVKNTDLQGKFQGENEGFEKTNELKEINSPKGIGIMETASDSGKLQNYREDKECSTGISGVEVVLSINTKDEADKEEVLKDSMKLQNNHDETESSTGLTGISGFEVVLNNNNEDKADKDKDLKDFDSNILAPESESSVLAEAAVEESDSLLDQSESSAKLAENLDLDSDLEVNKNNESETQASGSLKSQNNNEEMPGMRDISGFEIVLNIDTEAEVDKDKLSQNCAANEDNSESDNLVQLESDVVPPKVSLEEEESIAKPAQNMDLENQLGINEENVEIQASNTLKFQDNKEFEGLNANSGDIDSQTQLNEDRLLEEAKLDENFQSDEFEMNENNESGKHTESISGLSGDVVDFGNSYASEEKHSVESDFLFENYFEEKKTPSEVKSMERCGVDEDENLAHNLQGYLSQRKSTNNMEDHFTISCEAIRTSDENEMTSIKMVDRESDKAENFVVIEPDAGEELANKFDAEAHFEQDNTSTVKENFAVVHEREGGTSFPDTPDHNRFTTYQVEEIQKDEISSSDLESTNSKSRVLMVKGETSRDNASSLKEQNHSITVATPISLFNRFESLMMVNGTPASEFGNVHADSTLQEKYFPLAFSTDKPLNENYVGENRNSPLPSEDNTDKRNSVLCVDKELENPELSVSAEHLKGRNQSFGSDCSTEPEESEGIENEFNADFNTLSPEKETQPFEATSPETNIGFAENQGNGSTNDEVSPTDFRILFDHEAQENDSKDGDLASNPGFFLGNNFPTEEENNLKAVTEEEVISNVEHKDEDTQVFVSFDDLCRYIETISSPRTLISDASASKSAHTINLLDERNEGDGEIVSEQGIDDTFKEFNSPGESYNLSDENAVKIADEDREEVPMKDGEEVPLEDRDAFIRIHEEPTSVESDGVAIELDEITRMDFDKLNNEKKMENILNVSNRYEGVEMQFDDGMFDDFDGDQMEMVHTEKESFPSYSDHFQGIEKALVDENAPISVNYKEDEIEAEERAVNAVENFVSDETFEMSENLTKRADEADENQNHDKSNEYTENQNISQVSQCWSPDPQYGNSHGSCDSNVYSSWDLNVISEHKATKSTSIAFEKQLVKQSQSVEKIIPQESFSGDEIAKKFDEAKDLNDFTCFEGDAIETVCISETSRDVTFTGVSNIERSKDNIFVDVENAAGAGVDAMMVEEIGKNDVFVNENSGLERTENDCSQVGGNIVVNVAEARPCEAAEVLDFVIEDKSSECVDQINHCAFATDVVIEKNPLDKSEELKSSSMTLDNVAAGFEEPFRNDEFVEATETEDALMKDLSFDNTVQCSDFSDFATEGMEGNLELVDVEIASEIDKKCEATAVENSSMKLKMEKNSGFIKGTPKKLEIPLYMKENATTVKRENLGSVTAKSTAKRRALTELYK